MTVPLLHSNPCPTTRRSLLQQMAVGGLLVLFPQLGCRGILSRKPKCPVGECPPGETVIGIPRRIYVQESSPQAAARGGIEHQFAVEVVAALNQRPHCNALLLPPGLPMESLVQGAAEPVDPAIPPTTLDTDPALEELLLISVLEVVPYRPMRLQVMLERRHFPDGTLISRNHRTWNAPADCQPQGPSKFNRFILRNPAPLAAIEAQELNRLSPHAFMKNVAKDVAVELIATPV